MKKIVISVLGQDRPGILAAVSRILFEQDCNIENVHQSILQSEFSGIFIAAIPDEMAIGVINKKTTATRIIPVPGKKAGEQAHFGGLLGGSVILPVNNEKGENLFIRRGGRIPAPIHSLNN